MHEVEALKVLHPTGHLGGKVDQGREAQGLVGDTFTSSAHKMSRFKFTLCHVLALVTNI